MNVLSQEWIDEHAKAVTYDGIPDQTEVVYVDDLENLIEPTLGSGKLFEGEPKERHFGIVKLLHKTWVEKNERYGDSFSEVYGELGDISALTQVLHKVNRLKTLTVEELDGNGESLDDTLLDLANYCVMWLMER